MPAIKKVVIPGEKFFLEILKPNLGDLIPETGYYSGLLGEFTVLDDVVDSRKIVDIKQASNVLQRRDASCNIIYRPVGSASVRRISVTELYGATQYCGQEFYQGCLKDWRNADSSFVPRIFQFWRAAIRKDLVSNMYFGDTSRVDAAGAPWSTNKFDGIFTHWKQNIASGVLPAAQAFNVPAGAMTPAQAKQYLEDMYQARDEFSKLLMPEELSYTIDQEWADAYELYLESTGTGTSNMTNYVQNGVQYRAYRGIPIMVNKFFNPILRQITGGDAHFGTLTLRGNYMFATDKSYGEGPNLNEALRVWYSDDELTWKYLNVLKAGTAIIAPENAVLALPA
jgi:hypothetical protein